MHSFIAWRFPLHFSRIPGFALTYFPMYIFHSPLKRPVTQIELLIQGHLKGNSSLNKNVKIIFIGIKIPSSISLLKMLDIRCYCMYANIQCVVSSYTAGLILRNSLRDVKCDVMESN